MGSPAARTAAAHTASPGGVALVPGKAQKKKDKLRNKKDRTLIKDIRAKHDDPKRCGSPLWCTAPRPRPSPAG